MRQSLFVLLVSAALAGASPAMGAVDRGDWSAAVAAAQGVDPTMTALLPEPPSTTVVGGGKAIANGFPAFAMSAKGNEIEARGHMTLVEGFGNTFRADVVCLGAVGFPGAGGFAHIVGRLEEPAFGVSPTLEFFVTDSGQPGGEGDEWAGQFNPLPPETVPCTPAPSVTPIAHGNIMVDAGG